MKLYLYTDGDQSTGIFPCHFEIECPFNREDLQDEHDEDYFKEKMLTLYQEFVDFKLTARYDYELKQDAFEGDYPDYF